MTKKQFHPGDLSDLRRRAEEKSRASEAKTEEPLATAEMKRLVHELQVHQIELEMQNEELRRTQSELEISRARYFDLYDLAPVGYFTLNKDGVILEANATGAGLLGVVRCGLVNQPMARFILPEDQDIYYRHRRQLFATRSPQVCELRMIRKDAAPFWSRLESTVPQDDESDTPVYRAVISDITERKQAEEELARERQSLWKMLQASDHERQIISYEIHDGLAQYLAAAGMQFQVYDSLKENLPDETKEALETAKELVHQAHAESRRLISEVRPPVIDEIGLETAISQLIYERRKRGGPKIECHSDVQLGKLPPILENALYRIAQEALTNACKHSKSKKVLVTLVQQGQDVRLEVRDWGIGFDSELVKEGRFGVEGIRQRVRLLGGRLTIESKPDSGTLVQVVVPILEKRTED